MPNLDEKTLEKYDFVRAEIFSQHKNLPYAPRPITQVQKDAISFLFSNVRNEYSHCKTWADVPLKNLEAICKEIEQAKEELKKSSLDSTPSTPMGTSKSTDEERRRRRTNPNYMGLKYLDYLLKHKDKDYDAKVVEKFMDTSIQLMRQINALQIKSVQMVRDDSGSILKNLEKSTFFNDMKPCMDSSYKYPDYSDCVMLYNTITKDLEKCAYEEIEKRERFLESKIKYDDLDFTRMANKIREFYRNGEFKKGDHLFKYYTKNGDEIINRVSRGLVTLRNTENNTWIITEDLFLKTLLEIEEFRKIFKDKIESTASDTKPETLTLYRGLSLRGFLQTIQGAKPTDYKNWIDPTIPKTYDNLREIQSFLKNKISKDRAVISTTKKIEMAEQFSRTACETSDPNKKSDNMVLLIIHVEAGKTIDISGKSHFNYEEEVILSPNTKLQLKSVELYPGDPKTTNDDRFIINAKVV